MKQSLLLSLLLLALSAAGLRAQTPAWLTVHSLDGTEQSLPLSGLTVTLQNGSLEMTCPTDNASFSIDQVDFMELTAQASGISSGALAADLAAETQGGNLLLTAPQGTRASLYTLSGRLVMTLRKGADGRETLAAALPSGTYLLRADTPRGSRTLKICCSQGQSHRFLPAAPLPAASLQAPLPAQSRQSRGVLLDQSPEQMVVTLQSGVQVFEQSAQVGRITVDRTQGPDQLALQMLSTSFPLADVASLSFGIVPLPVQADELTKEPMACLTWNPATASPEVVVSAALWPHLVTCSVVGNHAKLATGPEFQQEAHYLLGGTSQDGSCTLAGEFKASVYLLGLQLVSQQGAALSIENGKRIALLVDGQNSLTDQAGGAHKACLFVKGHPEFTGTGSLSLTGRTKHAYESDEYTLLKKSFTGTISVLSAVGDGLHVGQYFEQRAGTVSVRATGGDCVDVGLTKNPADEQNGQALLLAGTMDLEVTTPDTKGLKTDKELTMKGGTFTALVSGDGCKGMSPGADLYIGEADPNVPTLVNMSVTGTTYMPGDPNLEAKCRGIKGKADFTFDGGNINISATGKKAKPIVVDGVYHYLRGKINCTVEDVNS